ncbi:methyltransferase [Alkalimonas amylolytica]|uniref:Ribosomal RNA small subunit methyltransferase C n=1 Tax=Alkalimonas amylolytica TaxID=152573 RepID=A0A1H3WZW8_ALKAM|nr:methyltransferase [Alkalimonas amylolytica]SDZ91922.1 16S rRNA (guanine1207-N2)-methyltransferase [Alkalimonas amylolytica]
MLTSASQMLLRNLADLTGPSLLMEPPLDQLAGQLPASYRQHIAIFSSHVAVAARWQQAGYRCSSGLKPEFAERFQTAVLFYPKSKEQLTLMLQQLQPVLTENADIFVVGDNKSGIKTLPKQLQSAELSAHKLDNARHALWFVVNGCLTANTISAQTFDVTLNSVKLHLHSYPGVFSHGSLDKGTALLLQHLAHIQSGRVLDFACGCGVIAAYLKASQPAIDLYASDVSTLATAATEATLAANGLTGTVLAADGLPVAPAQFEHIVSNPPFHTGQKTDYSIAEAFIRACPDKLSPGGSLTLVANNHLPYQSWLQESFGHCTILAQAHGFTIYQCLKSRK